MPLEFEVLDENLDAVGVFARLRTQWLYHPMGPRIGLNYPGVDSVIARAKVADPDDCFLRIQLMELPALEVFAEQIPKPKANG